MLHSDTILCICDYLSDKDKLRFLSTSKYFETTRHVVTFTTQVCIRNIINLLQFDQFSDIIASSVNVIFPRCIKRLTFGYFFEGPINNKIPGTVTHLTFGWTFNSSVRDQIPRSVTHLKFGTCFDSSVRDSIPQSVTHLAFGWIFNQPIDDSIPDSVTHLTFGTNFNQSIKGNIPNSVIYIVFGDNFNHPIDDLPKSVVRLQFGHGFTQSINSLPETVESVVLSKNYKLDICDNLLPKVFMWCLTIVIIRHAHQFVKLVLRSVIFDFTNVRLWS